MSGAERADWLASLRARDPALAADVVAMLDGQRAINDKAFLEEPLLDPRHDQAVAGLVIGAYRLTSRLGEGGMGTVWLAERCDGRFEGRAAVKFLNAGLMGPRGEERFKREGSILARLSHPNIARLIDAGVSSIGAPYLVLEYIDGDVIDRDCDARRLGIDARLALFRDVLGAVAHAHANLVVHRDLKPANVLVTKGGQVKLLDFGIAKLVEPDMPEIPEGSAGDAALTPAYAAPEQLTGGAHYHRHGRVRARRLAVCAAHRTPSDR